MNYLIWVLNDQYQSVLDATAEYTSTVDSNAQFTVVPMDAETLTQSLHQAAQGATIPDVVVANDNEIQSLIASMPELSSVVFHSTVGVQTATLSSIQVITNPAKLNYIAGESFEPTGMVVRATYSNGSTLTINNSSLSFSPYVLSTVGTVSVSISYTENGTSKATTLYVNVLPCKNYIDLDNLLSKGVLNQPEIEAKTEGVYSTINLVNGNMHAELPLISNGSGAYLMSVGLIYSSDKLSGYVTNTINTYLGSGYKLNVQQYLVATTDTTKPYVYLDAAGKQHTIAHSNGVYYDTSGLGLTMTTDSASNTRILTDMQGNQLVFNLDGYLTKSKGIFGNEINYTYTSGRLTQMTHASDSTRKMTFEYSTVNGETRLNKITDSASRYVEITYTTVYARTIPSAVTLKYSTTLSKQLYSFTYNNNRVSSIGLGSSSRKLEFSYDLSTSKLTSVSEKSGTATKWSKAITYDATNNQTTVTDNYSVNIVYSYKADGETYSVIETNGNKVTTLFPQTNSMGVSLHENATSQTAFSVNGKMLSTVTPGASTTLTATNLTENSDNIRSYATVKTEMENSELKTYVLGAWVKMSSPGDYEAYLTAVVGTTTVRAKIDTSLSGWQYVSKAFEISSYGNVSLKVESQFDTPLTVYVSDARFSPPVASETYIANGTTDYLVSDIVSATVNGTTVTFADGEFTGSDIEATLRNMFTNSIYSIGNASNQPYCFVYDRGRKIIGGVTSLTLTTNDGTQIPITQSMLSGQSIVSHERIIKHDGYITKYVTRNKYTTAQAYFGTNTAVNAILSTTSVSKHKIGSTADDITSTKIETYGFNGLPIKSEDSNWIDYEYQYDSYGNILNKTVIESTVGSNSASDRKELVFENTYTTKGEIHKEYNQYGQLINTYSHGSVLGIINSVTNQKNTTVNYTHNWLAQPTVVSSQSNTNNITYDADGNVSSMSHNGTNLTFAYDDFGSVSSCSIGGNTVISAANDYANNTSTSTYGNTYSVTAAMDKYGRVQSVSEGNTVKVSYTYTDDIGNDNFAAKLRTITDGYTNLTTSYVYDSNGNAIGYTLSPTGQSNSTMVVYNAPYSDSYDYFDHRLSYTVGGREIVNFIHYSTDLIQPRVQSLQLSLSKATLNNIYTSVSYTYDGFGNISTADSIWDKKTLSYNYNTGSSNEILSANITVKNGSTESQLLTHTLSSASDMRDNIASSVYTTPNSTGSDTTAYNYTYDALGRLTGETKVKNGATQSTATYTYNAGGNRTQMVKDGVTTTYTYDSDWKDRLASMEANGTTIYFTYDNVGNPTRYKTNSPTSSTNMTWTRGRLLSTYTYDTNKTASFTYDHSGRRYTKTANGITKTYFYDNDKLIAESWSNGLLLTYEYDILGIALMRIFKEGCDTVNLRFVTDALGNAIELRRITLIDNTTDYTSTTAAKYSYDAFGNTTVEQDTTLSFGSLSIALSQLNPFTYRSYYYDHETGLYYLMSRYYDPETGRFINADSIEYLEPHSINGLNLYTYCGNDPINKIDPSGENFIYNNSLNSKKLYSNKRYELLFSKFQFIDGGPYVNLDAKGWGKQGEFTTYQKVMYIIAGIGYVGILVSLGIGIFNMPLAISVFAFSTIVTIVSSVAGGFGGAT